MHIIDVDVCAKQSSGKKQNKTKHDLQSINIRTFLQDWPTVKSQFPVPLTYKDQTTRPAVLTLSSHFSCFI